MSLERIIYFHPLFLWLQIANVLKRLSQNTFLYFDMFLYSAYAAHYVYLLYIRSVISGLRETTDLAK